MEHRTGEVANAWNGIDYLLNDGPMVRVVVEDLGHIIHVFDSAKSQLVLWRVDLSPGTPDWMIRRAVLDARYWAKGKALGLYS